MLLFLIPIFLPSIWAQGYTRPDCSRSEYERCIRIADPLVREARLVFPDNMDDIDLVCKTWNRFVDCLKFYTENCFSEQQRKQFNRAVESPIESVHQMCMQPEYQKEYLQYAPCIKNTITQNIHCGPHYNLLVDQVSQGDIISKSTLCCSQDRFKQCVQRETRRLCDRGSPDGAATRFSTQIIDKALSFLQDQCANYIPNSGDCAINVDLYGDPLSISTSPSESSYPWSTTHQELAPKEVYHQSRSTQPQPSISTWLPSTPQPNEIAPPRSSSTTPPFLDKRTRPSSYGRSSGWSHPPNTPTTSNTVQMYPNTPSTPTSRPDWATAAWTPNNSPQNDQPFYTTRTPVNEKPVSETWYPAAGNQLNNEVDEPNQLGLRKNRDRNSSAIKSGSFGGLLILLTVLAIF